MTIPAPEFPLAPVSAAFAAARGLPTFETYSELQLVYDQFNDALFDGQLPPCLLTLQREKRTFGYFSLNRFTSPDGRVTHEIALNPAYFAIVPLVETLATIAHEMCHLWQALFGKPGRGRYHNEEWGQKMQAIGLMPSHNGQPGGRRTGDQMADYPIAGGRFLAACAQLLTQDFKISWYDRFTAGAVSPTDHSAAHALPAGALAIPADFHPGLAAATVRPGAAGDASVGMGVGGGVGEACTDGSGAAGGAPAPSNRSNRSKYTCSCDVSVWGKPRLSISCNRCDSTFVEFA